VKWGDYEDCRSCPGWIRSRLSGSAGFEHSECRAIVDLRATLTHLEIESVRHVHDLTPLGRLGGLTQLDVGGDWTSPR